MRYEKYGSEWVSGVDVEVKVTMKKNRRRSINQVPTPREEEPADGGAGAEETPA